MGNAWGAPSPADAARPRTFAELKQRVTEGALTLPVVGVFDAADFAAAVRLTKTAGRVGKVLLRF